MKQTIQKKPKVAIMNNHKFYVIMCGISYISAIETQEHIICLMFAFMSVVYGICALFTKDKKEQQ